MAFKRRARKADDEWYTPAEYTRAVAHLIPAGARLYEPFVGKGHMADELERLGFRVQRGADFFRHRPRPYDLVVTNPPYSRLTEVLEELYRRGKPWLAIVPLGTVETLKRRALLAKHGVSLILPKGRMKFLRKNGRRAKKPNFYACWAAWRVPGVCNNSIVWL